MKEFVELLRRLTQSFGPSGHEEEVRALLQEEAHRAGTLTEVDTLGNLIARTGNPQGPVVMLAAHMDEIGLMVTHADEKGFLRLQRIGGMGYHFLPGKRFWTADGRVLAVGVEKFEDVKDITWNKLYLDGPDVAPGTCLVAEGPLVWQGDRVTGKALDDRVGCAILLHVLWQMRRSPNQVCCVFTVQEEVGLRGAQTAAFGLQPHIGIAVDVTTTGDTPGAHPMAVSLGKGVAIKVADRSIITHPLLRQALIKTAGEANIPYQLEVLEKGGCDAGAIHLSREGVVTGAVSIPVRYVHTPAETADLRDIATLAHIAGSGHCVARM
jgi:putative aminopeptidase FrvX